MGNFTTLAGIATSLGGSTTVCVTDKTENKARTKTLIGTTIASTATWKEKEQMFAVENGATESYTENQKTR